MVIFLWVYKPQLDIMDYNDTSKHKNKLTDNRKNMHKWQLGKVWVCTTFYTKEWYDLTWAEIILVVWEQRRKPRKGIAEMPVASTRMAAVEVVRFWIYFKVGANLAFRWVLTWDVRSRKSKPGRSSDTGRYENPLLHFSVGWDYMWLLHCIVQSLLNVLYFNHFVN